MIFFVKIILYRLFFIPSQSKSISPPSYPNPSKEGTGKGGARSAEQVGEGGIGGFERIMMREDRERGLGKKSKLTHFFFFFFLKRGGAE